MNKTKNILYGSLIALAGLTASPKYGVTKSISQDSNPSNLEKTLASEPDKDNKRLPKSFYFVDLNDNQKYDAEEFDTVRKVGNNISPAVAKETENLHLYVTGRNPAVIISKKGIKTIELKSVFQEGKTSVYKIPDWGKGKYRLGVTNGRDAGNGKLIKE
ncbi:hypothetical protein ACRTDU_12720 [Sunxiuqinia elliptica]